MCVCVLREGKNWGNIFFDRPILHLAFTACNGGRYVEEATVMMKSALLFTKTKLHFHIFTDNVKWDAFSSEVGWVTQGTPPEQFCLF